MAASTFAVSKSTPALVRLSRRFDAERRLALPERRANVLRKLSGVAGPCDVHVKRRRIGAQQMVVQRGHLNALGKQLAHHRIDLAFGEDKVAHHHRFVPHRFEGEPAAEGEAGFEGHSVERDAEVAAGQPVATHLA